MGNDKETPAPEVLKPQDDADSQAQATETPEGQPSGDDKDKPHLQVRPHRTSYRPSHKATFIGIVVVVAILAVNVGVVAFLINRQSGKDEPLQREEVTISGETLGQLGVTRTPVGNLGTVLTVGPDASFNGKVTVAENLDVGGQLTLNSKFSATNASISKLEAGDTAVEELNINGSATATNLTLRKDLAVAGASNLQGAVTINNNLTVAGNITINGSLFVNNFQVSVLTINGHLVTRGAPPSVSKGGALGSNGTVSLSGNDASGTVAVNVGTGASSGTLVDITFRDKYGNTPHVVITPIGKSAPNVYVNRNSSGFSIATSSALSPGGYAFDYLIMQ
jgi:hypothetical protein